MNWKGISEPDRSNILVFALWDWENPRKTFEDTQCFAQASLCATENWPTTSEFRAHVLRKRLYRINSCGPSPYLTVRRDAGVSRGVDLRQSASLGGFIRAVCRPRASCEDCSRGVSALGRSVRQLACFSNVTAFLDHLRLQIFTHEELRGLQCWCSR
jgi:hypothetical protein